MFVAPLPLSQPSSSSVPEPIIPPPPAAPRPRSKPLTRSSPICNPEDEEFAIEDFLNWKGEALQSQRAKDRWNGVKEIVQNEMWSLEDLRDMSETSSHIYNGLFNWAYLMDGHEHSELISVHSNLNGDIELMRGMCHRKRWE